MVSKTESLLKPQVRVRGYVDPEKGDGIVSYLHGCVIKNDVN